MLNKLTKSSALSNMEVWLSGLNIRDRYTNSEQKLQDNNVQRCLMLAWQESQKLHLCLDAYVWAHCQQFVKQDLHSIFL